MMFTCPLHPLMGFRSPKGSAGREIVQVWIKIKDASFPRILCPLIPPFALSEFIATGDISQAMPLLYLADLAKFKYAVQWHTKPI